MFCKCKPECSFYGVAMMFILVGAFVFSFAVIAALCNLFANEVYFIFPIFKMIGGLIVMALGYIILEMEMMRKK